jgi:threonyl-tRNA synthetase
MPKSRSDQPSIEAIRHSLAHLLAAAVLKKIPEAKLGIGPATENGFYYDFLLPQPLTEEDLPLLEKEIKNFIKQALPFKGKFISPAEARKIFKHQPFKLELIKEFTREKKRLKIYRTGDIFIDLCRGGHVKNTKEINPQAFKLVSLAGAYWRGNERNPQLQRVYGLAFRQEKELRTHLRLLEEARTRDHRRLGQELGLFYFDELVGKGLPLWLPNGAVIKNEIEKLAVEMEEKYGYLRVATPHLAKEDLYLISGHLPYYQEHMYPPMVMDDGTYYLKAMNCPHHHLIYRSAPRSYRELPLRLAEYGTVYRNELSGTLAGLLRVRMLSMNDAHIYCRKDQIKSEVKQVIRLIQDYFKIFKLKNYWFRLSKWDPKHREKYINEPKNWVYAENILRQALRETKVKFIEAVGEAAFYGPKIDVQFKSVIGREETMSTVQLDFSAKERFGLKYRDRNGRDNNEVFVIHRAPLSTHERFIAFLLEHYAGALPLWLAPIQVAILAISAKQAQYATKVTEALKKAGLRVKLTESNETLAKRIRESEQQKIPYLLIVGEQEAKSQTVAVRKRRRGNLGRQKINQFLEQAKKEISQRK